MSLGTVVGMVGGSPLMKVRKVIGEFLPLTKSLDGGGGLEGLMKQVIAGGGLQAIAANPLAAVTGQIQGALGSAVGTITGALGGQAAGLVSALTGAGGLDQALGGLAQAGSGLLSGQGIMGMIGHANIAEMAGSALPAGLGIDAVLGPLTADGLLGDIQGWVPGMVADVVSGVLPLDAAIGQTLDLVATVTGVVDASAHALTTLSDLAPDIAAVSTMAAAFVSAPAEIGAVLERALPADAVATMRASVATHLDV